MTERTAPRSERRVRGAGMAVLLAVSLLVTACAGDDADDGTTGAAPTNDRATGAAPTDDVTTGAEPLDDATTSGNDAGDEAQSGADQQIGGEPDLGGEPGPDGDPGLEAEDVATYELPTGDDIPDDEPSRAVIFCEAITILDSGPPPADGGNYADELTELLPFAPADIADDVTALRDYHADGFVAGDPDTDTYDRFPDDVRTSVDRVVDRCGG